MATNFTINFKALFDVSDVKSKVNDIQNVLGNIKLPDKLQKSFNSSFTSLNKALSDYESKLEKGINTKADAKSINTTIDKIVKEYTKVIDIAEKIKAELGDSVDLDKIIKIDPNSAKELKKLRDEAVKLKKELATQELAKIDNIQEKFDKITSKNLAGKAETIFNQFKSGDIENAIAAMQELYQYYNALKDKPLFQNNDAFQKSVAALKEMKEAMEESVPAAEKLKANYEQQAQVAQTAFNNIKKGVSDSVVVLKQQGAQITTNSDKLKGLANSQAQFISELDQVKSRIQYFFGLANSINLVKRAIRSAVDTIKELDKAMTETAVVTDFSVGDMWEQLPEYTKRANELGVSTLAAYQAATLYYQQGLKTNEVNALSVETLKMARIAGLDAAEATDRMTNALRGFNMELTEANAQRVDDVYSELAANTASNVDEISTAMTKVASLAHNANMEFETTAAFLSQIIETTRESAETAGTALKTVVARFSEVKKLIDTNQLKGQDEEGQVIDVNRVGQALRTAGIDLNKYFLGEVGLDDIFIELASKWDTLTSVQQRYIATQAAGSRQQSRFIALMADYARTQELVSKAYNANGASAKQFAKTQDSLESKLARLKNAWNEFLMGLTNNQMVKGFVDLLTTLLNTINKLTSAFGEGAGSVAKWGVALGSVIAGKALFKQNGLLDNGIGMLANGTVFSEAFRKRGIGGVYTGVENAGVRPTGIISTLKEKAQAFKKQKYWYEYEDIPYYKSNKYQKIVEKLQQSNAYSGSEDIWEAADKEYFGNKKRSTTAKKKHRAYPKTMVGAIGKRFGDTTVGSKIIDKMGFKTMAGGAKGAAAGVAALGTAIAAVTAAAVIAGVAIKGIYDMTPAGQIASAEKLAATLNNVAQAAQKTSEEFKKAADSYSQYNDAVKNAKNIKDLNKAIDSRNEYINSLIESNNEFAKYTTASQQNGQLVLTIDEDQLKKVTEEQTSIAAKASMAADFGRAAVAGQKADQYAYKGSQIKGYYGKELTSEQDASKKQYLYKESQSRSEAAQAAQQAYLRALSDQELDDTIANTIAGALGKSFDEDKWSRDIAQQRQRNYHLGVNLDKEYEELTGQKFEKGTSNKKKSELLAAAQITEKYTDQADKVVELLKGSDSGLYKNILSAMDGSELANLDLTGDANDILKNLGISEAGQQLKTLATTLGVPIEKLTTQIENNINLVRKQQKERVKTNAANLMAGGATEQTINSFINLSFDQQQVAQDILESIDSSMLTSKVSDAIIAGVELGGQEFNDAFLKLDLSNPIQGYDQLLKLASNTNPRIQQTAKALLEAGESTDKFSAANQLAFLYTSENYDAVAESLEKLQGENDNISSANIIEAAKSSADLAAMLDDGTMSAKALAIALNALTTGEITINNLSNSIIAALNAMDDLDGAVKRTIDDLNNFDPGYDENDVTGFIDKVYKNATENIEKGAWGNNVMGNYMEKIFGEFEYTGPKEGYGDAYKSWLQTNVKWLEANKDNMFSAWDDFASTLNNKMLGLAEIYEQDGEIIINANGMTTEQLVNAMVATGKVTQTQAEMMIADFKNYSADFKAEMAANDLPNAMQAWYDALPEIDGQKIYDETELETLKTLLGASDKAIADAIAGLGESANKLRGIKWTDGNGERTADSIKQALDDTGKELNAKVHPSGAPSNVPDVTTQFFDYDKVKQAYMDLGIPQMFESDFNKIAAESGQFYANLFGSQTKITIEEGQTAGEAYAQAYQEAVNKNLAKQFADLFTEETFKVEISTKDSEENVDTLQGKLDKISEGASGEAKVTAAEGTLNLLETITSYLNQIKDKHATVTIEENHQPAATGGIVHSYASGTHSLQPGFALTGEEGPEIIWNKEQGYAYITGKNGAEFQDLQPGDQVFNAAETQRILRNSSFAKGGIIPSYAKGYEDASKNKKKGGSGGGSGSGSDKDDEWRNELDWLYNVMENIAELERRQVELQEQYDDLLKDQNATGHDLYKNLIKQMGVLQATLDHQTYTLERREQEMREFMDTTNDEDEYLWYNWEDRTLEIDWDKINEITDQEKYDHITDLIDRAEEIQDKMDDAEDAIQDVKNQIEDLENIWRDTFRDFEDRVLDAIVKMYQTVIDNYSELNDTLNESNQQILDSINKEISLQRQIRDNTKTEQEIADDEARLAYLQRDTTGGNDLAALQMGKELEDQRESYSDNLIDQAIQRLQDDNDAAAQQREKQIEIMQAQLDYQAENGEFNAYLRDLLDTAVDTDGHLATDSALYRLLAEQDNIKAMTDVERSVWEEELNGTFKEVMAFMLKEQGEAEGSYFTAVTAAFNGISETFDKAFHGSTSQGSAHGSKSSSSGGSGGGGGGNCPKGGNHTPTQQPDGSTVCSKCGKVLKSAPKTETNQPWYVKTINSNKSTGSETRDLLAEKLYLKKNKIPKNAVISTTNTTTGGRENGGIVQQTGFGMLHGTISEPEYVLNARQTDAFLKLADVLPTAMSPQNSGNSTIFGDTTNNIVINVDRIDSDYSVDQMVDRVKEKLFETGSYRNNTVLSLLR